MSTPTTQSSNPHATTPWDLDSIAALLFTAGQRAITGSKELHISEKHDKTLVTQIDIEIEEYITKETSALHPNSYHIGEETIRQAPPAYLRDALSGPAWIIDPIDGTMPFAYGLPSWGISLGYADRGVVKEGALFLPISGTLLISENKRVLHYELGADPRAWAPALARARSGKTDAHTLPPLRSRQNDRGIISISQDCARYGRIVTHDGIQSVGSCVYSLVHFLLGNYKSILTHVKLWDIAAGLAFLDLAGGCIITSDDTPVTSDFTSGPFILNNNSDNLLGMYGHIAIAPTLGECQSLQKSCSVKYPE